MAWHLHGSDAQAGPLDVWLIDSGEVSTRITTGSDWCLITEMSAPYEGYDMEGWGRVKVAPIKDETPFADHLGETVLAVREERESGDGRVLLEITSEDGRILAVSQTYLPDPGPAARPTSVCRSGSSA